MRQGAKLAVTALTLFLGQSMAGQFASAMTVCPSWTSNGTFAGQMARYKLSHGNPSRLPPVDVEAATAMQREEQQFAQDGFQDDAREEGFDGSLVEHRLRARLAAKVPQHASDLLAMGRQELVDCIPGAAAVFAATDNLKRQNERAQAIEDHPELTLLKAYHDYIGIRACQKARAGYEEIYVSDDEVENAKNVAKAIEEVIRQKMPSIDKNKLWNDADHLKLGELVDKSQVDSMNEHARQYALIMQLLGAAAVESGQFNDRGKAFCSGLLTSLQATATELGIAQTHKKDF